MIYSSSFAKAHRKEFYRRLGRVVRGGADDSLPAFGELQTRLHLFNQSYRGLQTIEVSKIVGTVDRTGDFGRDFLPRSSESRERWQRIERAFPTGGFPPISAYRVRDIYFVIDGNHRVALAKQRNAQFIDAEITEIHTDLDIDEDIDFERILYLEQARQFMEQSGLARARPTARIDFTRIQGFARLLELVKVHGYDLMVERGELLQPEDVAADWYDRVYTPAIESILGMTGTFALFGRCLERAPHLMQQAPHQLRRTMNANRRSHAQLAGFPEAFSGAHSRSVSTARDASTP